MLKMNNAYELVKRSSRKKTAIATSLLLVLLLAWLFTREKGATSHTSFSVARGQLQIKVLEGGTIEAMNSQEVRSEVKGNTKILSIVEEGYLVTEEDIKNGKVLVELDSSELRLRITSQDIQFQSTFASLVEAQQSYDIQMNQNQSDIKTAEQKVRFAYMDLEKFLGDQMTRDIVQQVAARSMTNREPSGVPSPPTIAQATSAAGEVLPVDFKVRTENLALSTTNLFHTAHLKVSAGEGFPAEGKSALPQQSEETSGLISFTPGGWIDFTRLASPDLLGDGEAMQKLRKMEDDLLMAQTENSQSKSRLEGTQRLYDKGFVTKTELETEQVTMEKNQLKVQTSQTAHALFIKYEFPKQGEELLSKYEEALQALDRARKQALSKLAQAEAKLKSTEGKYSIEERTRKELKDQVEKCFIRATKPGLVVYGGGGERMYYSEEQIREGATIRERQPIITIPDMSQMLLKLRIHESYIKKVAKGMKATIQIDAFPEKKLDGEVIKVGVLPDSQNRWFNPDMKVYLTSLRIEGTHLWLKPGMSGKAEIHVKTLENVLYVPLQAVTPADEGHVCYVQKGGKSIRRKIEAGDFNDEFIEILSGLQEGESVLLHAPDGAGQDSRNSKESDTRKNEEKTIPPVSI